MAEKKQINIQQVVTYLNHAFYNAAQKAVPSIGYNNSKGTKMYQYQVDFAYLINEIQKGPKNFVHTKISEANELIAKLVAEQ